MASSEIQAVKTARFLKWLRDHGAHFEKISWPSNDTPTGSRGGVAVGDIQTDEHMVTIPTALLLTPISAQDSEIGHVFHDNPDVFHGDDILTVFCMHERAKGESSFYHAYLDILPVPTNISCWGDEELNELQDSKLVGRAKKRRLHLKNNYARLFTGLLTSSYPELFDRPGFSVDEFRFAWHTIEARAFGRRLPWSALVPFADCLNHGNVASKYDWDVKGNGVFRLFPTGTNCYATGSEVLNSYGRRNNATLLLDYGFCMLDNEWETVDVPLRRTWHTSRSATGDSSGAGALRLRTLLLRTQVCRGDGSAVSGVSGCKGLCWRLLTYFRVWGWERGTVDLALKNVTEVEKPRVLTEEVIALDGVIDALADALSRFPTTLEEDEVLLGEGMAALAAMDVEPERLHAALTYRVTVKRVLMRQLRAFSVIADHARRIVTWRQVDDRCAEGAQVVVSEIDALAWLPETECNRVTTYISGLSTIPLDATTAVLETEPAASLNVRVCDKSCEPRDDGVPSPVGCIPCDRNID